MPSTELFIDEQAASVPLDASAVRAWGSRQRVFVSSLITNMPTERTAARAAIESLGAIPVMFEEDLGGQDVTAETAYLSGVRTSTIYVGLLAERYGVKLASGYSATEAEFNAARADGLRLCVFVKAGNGQFDGPQADFIGGLRNSLTTSTWSTPDDLKLRIARRLTDLAAEELAPWVRLGNCLFRATEISSSTSKIVVTADVRNGSVQSELVRLRDQRAGDLIFVTPVDAQTVQVAEIESSMTTTASRTMIITLNVRGAVGQGMRMGTISMGNQTYTADQLDRMSLEDGLFGSHTLPQSGFQRAVDPLESIRGRNLVDAVLRPVARLLLNQHLLTSGNADRLVEFRLGPSANGARRLLASWVPRRRYDNQPASEVVSIDGQIKGL